MPAILVDTTLFTHPKSNKLSRRLGEPAAWHYVVRLWGWAMDQGLESGVVDASDEDIADLAGWSKDPAEFVAALVECGWLKPKKNGYELHAFRKRNERFFKERKRKTEWWRKHRGKNSTSSGRLASARADVSLDAEQRAPSATPYPFPYPYPSTSPRENDGTTEKNQAPPPSPGNGAIEPERLYDHAGVDALFFAWGCQLAPAHHPQLQRLLPIRGTELQLAYDVGERAGKIGVPGQKGVPGYLLGVIRNEREDAARAQARQGVARASPPRDTTKGCAGGSSPEEWARYIAEHPDELAENQFGDDEQEEQNADPK